MLQLRANMFIKKQHYSEFKKTDALSCVQSAYRSYAYNFFISNDKFNSELLSFRAASVRVVPSFQLTTLSQCDFLAPSMKYETRPPNPVSTPIALILLNHGHREMNATQEIS